MQPGRMTLKQVQMKLRTEQHVLIHLCEKGVIEPDIQQTRGRGIRREFSQRNLFEFAVALAVRKYGIPVATTAAIVRLLRSFERSTQRRMKGFNLLGYLQAPAGESRILLTLYDGHYMVFSVEVGGALKSITGFDIVRVMAGVGKAIKFDRLEVLPSDFDSYLMLDLRRLAASVA